jgi:uroporphyrinogen III methyltransferase / synthase
MAKGKIYLVGAGPGDVMYLTLKAYKLLEATQVLIYDALVDSQLLNIVPSDCLKLDVGKRGGQPSTSQTEINNLLVEYCQQGKQVVRLKSGDPFIFGRCTSEIEALKSHSCAFEVVPGISSATSAPLLAGIPLTDPVLSRCFAVMTAHEVDALNWEALAAIDTLVILMGGKNLAEIIYRLIRQGRSRSTPIAIVRYCGTPQQQIWTGTLETILEITANISLSPAVITIGEVVGLQKYLQAENIDSDDFFIANSSSKTMASNIISPPYSITQAPLTGKTVLVTRSVGQSSQFTEMLVDSGANVIEMPALEICPPSSWEKLDSALGEIATFDWLILTSTNAVEYFFERLFAQGKDVRSLCGVKIAVVGEKTAQCMKQRCLKADFIPPDFVADSLIANFPEDLQSKRVLFPRVESGGREVLVKELTAIGAEVVEVPAYQSCCPSNIPPSAELALQSGTVDIITFASSKTVQFFCQLAAQVFAGNSIGDCLEGVCIASIGPQTSKTCRELIGRVDVEAQEYTLPGLTQAVIKWGVGNRE